MIISYEFENGEWEYPVDSEIVRERQSSTLSKITSATGESA